MNAFSRLGFLPKERQIPEVSHRQKKRIDQSVNDDVQVKILIPDINKPECQTEYKRGDQSRCALVKMRDGE